VIDIVPLIRHSLTMLETVLQNRLQYRLQSTIRTVALGAGVLAACAAQGQDSGSQPILLHAARLLEVDSGRMLEPGEVLVSGDRITGVGSRLERPAGAKVIDLGDTTLMPGLIDAHVHLFLHPGAEDLQTVEESVPARVILAEQAAKADLMAGYTAERDMGTEGAGSADTAIRDAINEGVIAGPRMRISGNAIDLLGGHEDAIGYNPAQHVLSNADYANSADEMVTEMRAQHKEGSDFAKIYETGKDMMVAQDDGSSVLHTPYQYTAAQLTAAVAEAHRLGTVVAVHAMGEPGTLYAAQAGVASIDHATQLSAETMRLMMEKKIPAVPTGLTGGSGTGEGAAGLQDWRIQAAGRGRDSLCGGIGCGAVPAWHTGRGDGADGALRDEAAGGVAGRPYQRGGAAGMGRPDWTIEGRLPGGRDRRTRGSAERHCGDRACGVCDEGRPGGEGCAVVPGRTGLNRLARCGS
jgi:imidazolonepropionase-like amidohydrolase